MLTQLRGLFFLCAFMLVSAQVYAVPPETKICDLGELLRSPERMAASGECAALYIKVKDQPISCGLYDKLTKEMKDSWVKASREICGKSEACNEVMAQCAARQLSGKDLSAGNSGQAFSAQAGSNNSQPTRERSLAESTSASNKGTRTNRIGAAAPSAPQGGSSPGSTISSPRSQRSTNSAASSSATTSSVSSSSNSSAGSSSSIGTPDCYVCIYDSTDSMTQAKCQVRGRNARRSGIRNVVVVSHIEALYESEHKNRICGCKNIDMFGIVHGKPGQEDLPFKQIKTLLKVAPQCSNIALTHMNCSGFDSVTKALAEADTLSRDMAKSGYEGTVTVTGNQTVTSDPSSSADVLAQYDIDVSETTDSAVEKAFWSALVKTISPVSTILMTIRAPRRVLLNGAMQKEFCDHVNTPIGFQVCASGVTLALSPCKPVGHVSEVDKGENATQTILCAKDGKRANQSCSYIELKDVPDITLADGRTLLKTLSDFDYGEDGCKYEGQVCLCKWEEPSVCSS